MNTESQQGRGNYSGPARPEDPYETENDDVRSEGRGILSGSAWPEDPSEHEDVRRRSQRVTKGQAPPRYGQTLEPKSTGQRSTAARGEGSRTRKGEEESQTREIPIHAAPRSEVDVQPSNIRDESDSESCYSRSTHISRRSRKSNVSTSSNRTTASVRAAHDARMAEARLREAEHLLQIEVDAAEAQAQAKAEAQTRKLNMQRELSKLRLKKHEADLVAWETRSEAYYDPNDYGFGARNSCRSQIVSDSEPVVQAMQNAVNGTRAAHEWVTKNNERDLAQTEAGEEHVRWISPPRVPIVKKKPAQFRSPSPPRTRRQLTPSPTRTRFTPSPPPSEKPSEVLSDAVKVMADALVQRTRKIRDLPGFSGDPMEWPLFYSQFKMTTKTDKISDEDNLYRLQKSLKGKAKETVQALLLAPENLSLVIETLEQNFGRPKLIVHSLLIKARSILQCKEGRPEMVRDLSNALSNLVATMTQVKCTGHLSNPELLETFLAKVPCSRKMEWAMYVRKLKEEPTLRDFATWLKSEAEAASELVTYSGVTSKPEEKAPDERKRERRPDKRKETVLATTEEVPGKGENQKSCSYCDKPGHPIGKCRSFSKQTTTDRWTWARKNQVCFGCLKSGHRQDACSSIKKCAKDGCEASHHLLLHPDRRDEEKKETTYYTTGAEKIVLLRVIPVTLRGPQREVRTFALLDEASTVTLVDSSLADSLGLKGQKQHLSLHGISSDADSQEESRSVSMSIVGAEPGKVFEMKNVRTVSNMNIRIQSVNMKKMAVTWKYLDGLGLTSYSKAKPQILIGQDNCDLIVAREVREGQKNEPVATLTKLGWVVHGNLTTFKGRQDCEFSYHIVNHEEDALHQLVKESFRTEDFGVKLCREPHRSIEDRQIMKMMDENTICIPATNGAGRWTTGLPWRDGFIELPESRSTALKRLFSLEKKLDKDPAYASQYCLKMEHNMKMGYARKLTNSEVELPKPRTWYLPHFGVERPCKPGKIRIVLDAAAKSRGICLNDGLLQGPDLLNPLPTVLFKFREGRIGFTADIKEMFPQIKIRPEDSPAQRFLWRGMDRNKPPDSFEMSSMIFGAVSSPFCAQDIKNRNAKRFHDEFPDAEDAIINRHYMDDYLDSSKDVESALQKISEVIEVHRRGSFEICNWISSSREVMAGVPANLRSMDDQNLDLGSDLPSERVLGLQWDPNDDVFVFLLKFYTVDQEIVNGTRRPTKRETLKLVMSIFDPLGFLSHFTVKAKVLLQDIWRSGVGWDDELTASCAEKWYLWIDEMKLITGLKIPRCYVPEIENSKDIQLHIFCDASEKAFAAVAYLRADLGHEVKTAFVTAKTRVAPLRPMSIPRLELQAALMGSRLSETVRAGHSIQIQNVHFWSDSKTVLCWLRSDARNYKPFIAHRVGEIEELTDGSNWHWIPTAENVADEATRDSCESNLENNSRWLHGPAFLKYQEDRWPKERAHSLREVNEDDLELKKESVFNTTQSQPALNVTKYSSLWKAVRVTAWCSRIAKVYRSRGTKHSGKYSKLQLSVIELNAAEKILQKRAQLEDYALEIICLASEKPIPKSSSLWTLSPKLDKDGLMRMEGRINRAPLLYQETKNPLILHAKNPLTRLIVTCYHEKAGHQGLEHVVNELRQKFWIPRMRAAVKDAFANCLRCKIKKAKPKNPEMGQLPAFRLTQSRPFRDTGVDYFGPMPVTVGRRREKRYGVLFTCLATRAIHLEIAATLDTNSAIMAIRRMIGRRGCPTVMHSDNGTNFHGADNELKKAIRELDHIQISGQLSEKGIDWRFIPPSAPHMGGCWERLVQSVKKALSVTLNERAPREEVLQTLFVEAESLVNSRPLTHVSTDPDDSESLTPNHFLIGSSSASPIPGFFDDHDLDLRRQWRIAQRLTDHFWKRWVKEYLPSLTKRTKWHQPQQPPKVGDLVFIADGDLPRGSWPRGIITALFPGEDGTVRVVDVKTGGGVFRRPLAKVCILDVEAKKVLDVDPKPGGSMSPPVPTSTTAPEKLLQQKGELPAAVIHRKD